MYNLIKPTKYLTIFIFIAFIILDLSVVDDIVGSSDTPNILHFLIIGASIVVYSVLIINFILKKRKLKNQK